MRPFAAARDGGGPRAAERGGHATPVAPWARWGPPHVRGVTLSGPCGRSVPCPGSGLGSMLAD
eukprot:15277949-Alexandrium_andersonii.AAC.1